MCLYVCLPLTEALKEWQDAHNVSQDVLPLSFWRDAKYMLPPVQKAARSVSTTPTGQLAFVKRYLAELGKNRVHGLGLACFRCVCV